MSATDSTTQPKARTRKARTSTPTAGKTTVTNVVGSHGRSATGDNGGGRKPRKQTETAVKKAAAAKKAEPAKASQPKAEAEPNATIEVITFDRFRAVATRGTEVVQDESSPNGSITEDAAMKAAKRLVRHQDGEGWQPGTERFDRFTVAVVPADAKLAPLPDPHQYGHKEREHAIACGQQVARKANLTPQLI